MSYHRTQSKDAETRTLDIPFGPNSIPYTYHHTNPQFRHCKKDHVGTINIIYGQQILEGKFPDFESNLGSIRFDVPEN